MRNRVITKDPPLFLLPIQELILTIIIYLSIIIKYTTTTIDEGRTMKENFWGGKDLGHSLANYFIPYQNNNITTGVLFGWMQHSILILDNRIWSLSLKYDSLQKRETSKNKLNLDQIFCIFIKQVIPRKDKKVRIKT